MILDDLRGKQREFFNTPLARLNFLWGSVRSGKTHASILKWLDYILTGPPGPLAMIGNTLTTIRQNVLVPMQELVGRRNMQIIESRKQARLWGREIELFDAKDAASHIKMQGRTFAGAYGDEVTTWHRDAYFMILSRLSVAGASFMGTLNPAGPHHWLKKEVLDRAGELDLRTWHFTLEDNPSLDPVYVANLKKEYVGVWRKRYIDGLWVAAEGAIFSMFSEARHVVDDIPAGTFFREFIVPIDYGTSNATVFLRMAMDNRDTLWVLDEWYYSGRDTMHQKTDEEYSKDLQAWVGGQPVDMVVVDPSAASFIAQLRKDGWRVRSADNAVVDGIRDVQSRLSNDTLKIVGERCPNLIREMHNYAWDPKATERGEDAPLKQDDHAVDALRYGAYTVFPRRYD